MTARVDIDTMKQGSSPLDAGSKSCNNCFKPRRSVEDVSSREMHFKMPKYLTDSYKNMFRMRGDGLLTDVVLQLDTEEVKAHKLVLAAASPYFKALFTGGLRETSMESIRLQGVCPYTFSRLMLFCYTGELTVNEQTVCALLPAATMFQMQHVIDMCCNFLKTQLEPCNAIGIASYAEQHGCMDLLHTATRFIEQHFSQVVQDDEFMMLTSCQLVRMIHRDELNVFDERHVYTAVLRWVMHDEPVRRPQMESILRAVRCELLSTRYLKHQLDVQPLPDDCRQYLTNKLNEMTLHRKTRTNERTPTAPCVVYVVGGYMRCSLDRLESCTPGDQLWHELQPLPEARSGLGAAFMAGLLYAVGGRKNNPTGVMDTARVDCYNPITNSWRGCSALLTARSRLSAALLDGCIYAVGGSNQQLFLNSVERYCPDSERWTPVAGMSCRRIGLGVAVLDRLLYAVGGYDGQHRLRSAECYHPDQDRWTAVPDMNTARSGVGIGVLDRYIYVVGGYDGSQQLSTVERFDTESQLWQSVCPLPSARSALSVAVDEGKLYALGGFDGTQFLSSVDVYDPVTDSWSARPPLTSARSGHVSAVSVRPCFVHTDPDLLERRPTAPCLN